MINYLRGREKIVLSVRLFLLKGILVKKGLDELKEGDADSSSL